MKSCSSPSDATESTILEWTARHAPVFGKGLSIANFGVIARIVADASELAEASETAWLQILLLILDLNVTTDLKAILIIFQFEIVFVLDIYFSLPSVLNFSLDLEFSIHFRLSLILELALNLELALEFKFFLVLDLAFHFSLIGHFKLSITTTGALPVTSRMLSVPGATTAIQVLSVTVGKIVIKAMRSRASSKASETTEASKASKISFEPTETVLAALVRRLIGITHLIFVDTAIVALIGRVVNIIC